VQTHQIQQPQPVVYSNPTQHPVHSFNYQPQPAYNPQPVVYSSQPSAFAPQNIPLNPQPVMRNVAPIMHEMLQVRGSQINLLELKKTFFQRAQPIHVPETQHNQPLKYSLSSDVSSVKFSSNGLNYNF
jgi:hypothetical protein